MLQINNGFNEAFYLQENGLVYNSTTKKLHKPNSEHLFILRDPANRKKQISQKCLYRLIYNKEFVVADDIEDLVQEHWKEIKFTNGAYLVSDKGRVKSLKGYKARLLQPYANSSNYLRVDIVRHGSRQSVLVHRLVAEAFLPVPEGLDFQLHHKDFNKSNNAADNLTWKTPAEHQKIHKERNKKNVSA